MKDIEKQVYDEMIDEISKFLNGDIDKIKLQLEAKMLDAAEKLEFERAKEMRDLMAHIDSVMEKQKIITDDLSNRDVFGYAVEKGWICS